MVCGRDTVMNFFLSDGFFSDICMSIDIIEVCV